MTTRNIVMATRTIGKLMGFGRTLGLQRSAMTRNYSSLWTPDYLEVGKSKIPLHVMLNVQIKSYNYPVLESYQSFIDVLAGNMDIEVDNGWAFPPKCVKITKLKPNSTVVVAEYELKEYERDIQLSGVSATQYPILLRLLEASLPEGVTLRVEYWNELKGKKRYVPDKDLLNLKDELQSIYKK